ncbi:MAG: S-layer protein domain-containing protein [Methanohalobium sp.]|uniref:S-layer protein domain-containing protein n=1 Tax=Methanohalobium sp. TaxID=2837493 RepID=UPI0039795D7A
MSWRISLQFITLLVVILPLFSGTGVVSSQLEDENNDNDVPVVLINGTKINLKSDETYSFYQGYSLQIKGINLENDRLWLELTLNGESVKDDVVHEDDPFIYSRNQTMILNITADKIYSNPEGELVTFKPVYQYLDPKLETPKLNNTDDPANNNNSSTSVNNPENNSMNLTTIFTVIGMITIGIIVVYILFKHTS